MMQALSHFCQNKTWMHYVMSSISVNISKLGDLITNFVFEWSEPAVQKPAS